MLILVPTVYQCVYSICMYIHSFELYIDLSDVHVLFSFVQRHINDGTDTHMHHCITACPVFLLNVIYPVHRTLHVS